MIEKDIIITSAGAGSGILVNSLLKNAVDPIFSVPYLPPPYSKPSISVCLGVGIASLGTSVLWKNLRSEYKGFLAGFGISNTICSLLQIAFPETSVARAPITPYKRVPSPAMQKAIAPAKAPADMTPTFISGDVILH